MGLSLSLQDDFLRFLITAKQHTYAAQGDEELYSKLISCLPIEAHKDGLSGSIYIRILTGEIGMRFEDMRISPSKKR